MEKSGITLIALVVTIVVLLILAGITINFVMGDNGIFKTAESAKGKQKEAEYLEQIKIAVANSKINANRTINTSVLESSLNSIQGASIAKEDTEGNLPWTVSTTDGYKFQIKADGTVEAVSGITVSQTSLNLEQGDEVTLTVTFTQGVSGTVTWTSSSPEVATVDSTGKVTAVAENGTATITATVTSNGKTHTATCTVTLEVAVPATWDTTKVVAVKSTDNVIVPVPKGFTASTETTERSVVNGFVIKQNGTNNEFVWVPYNTFKATYPMFTTRTVTTNEETGETKTINIGQLYNYNTTAKTVSPYNMNNNFTNNSYREPDTVTTTGSYPGDEVEKNYTDAGITLKAGTETVKEKFASQLEEEFEEMKISVEKYGGFYIGRYETGNWHENETKYGTKKAIVAKGCNDISATSNGANADTKATWYAYYQKSKEIVNDSETYGAKSSMIWGCQWDAILNWFVSQEGTKKDYVFDSRGKGNYLGTNGNQPIATGHENYDVNNIFDMAGNVYDWTLEAGSTYSRVTRGGVFAYAGSSDPASLRTNLDPANSAGGVGARSTLIM